MRRPLPSFTATAPLLLTLLQHPLPASSQANKGLYIPISYTIPYRQEECLYERITTAGEHLTASVFVVSGEELKAAVSMEGPIAPPHISDEDNGKNEMGQELQKFIVRYAKEGIRMFLGENGDEKHGAKPIRVQQMLDFEAEPDEEDFDYDDEAGDIFDTPMEDDEKIREERLKRQVDHEAEITDDYVRHQMQLEAEMVMRRRRLSDTDDFEKLQMDHEKHGADKEKRTGAGGWERGMPPRQEHHRNHQPLPEKLMAGEPWEHTVQIATPGWYRLCVRAKVQTIEVEMELRKSSVYGKIDPRTGHVPSLEEVEIHTEIHDLFEKEKDPEIPEGAIKDEDLRVTKEQLRILERVYQDIIAKQLEERRVWNWRTLKNQHSYSHMVLGNLLETVMYMGITGFQIYTIRKWFAGGPALGK